MRFLTEAELRDDYGDAVITRLADRNGDGSADAGIVDNAILDAEDEVLGYLRGRFADSEIPSTTATTSRRLKVLVAALAYYNLHKALASTPFRARDGRADALANLDAVRSGRQSILLSDAPAVDSGRAIVAVSRRSSTYDEDRITLATMRDWGHERR